MSKPHFSLCCLAGALPFQSTARASPSSSAATLDELEIDAAAAFFAEQAYLKDETGIFPGNKPVATEDATPEVEDQSAFDLRRSERGPQEMERHRTPPPPPPSAWVEVETAFSSRVATSLSDLKFSSWTSDDGRKPAVGGKSSETTVKVFDPRKMPVTKQVRHDPRWGQQDSLNMEGRVADEDNQKQNVYSADFQILQALHKEQPTATSGMTGHKMHHVVLIGRNMNVPNVLFIAFRGTANMLVDYVHSNAKKEGFTQKFEAVRLQLLALVHAMFLQMIEHQRDRSERSALPIQREEIDTLVFTGHSLGGAAARHAAADAKFMMMGDTDWDRRTVQEGRHTPETSQEVESSAVENEIRKNYKTNPRAADVFWRGVVLSKSGEQKPEGASASSSPTMEGVSDWRTQISSLAPRWKKQDEDDEGRSAPMLSQIHWSGILPKLKNIEVVTFGAPPTFPKPTAAVVEKALCRQTQEEEEEQKSGADNKSNCRRYENVADLVPHLNDPTFPWASSVTSFVHGEEKEHVGVLRQLRWLESESYERKRLAMASPSTSVDEIEKQSFLHIQHRQRVRSWLLGKVLDVGTEMVEQLKDVGTEMVEQVKERAVQLKDMASRKNAKTQARHSMRHYLREVVNIRLLGGQHSAARRTVINARELRELPEPTSSSSSPSSSAALPLVLYQKLRELRSVRDKHCGAIREWRNCKLPSTGLLSVDDLLNKYVSLNRKMFGVQDDGRKGIQVWSRMPDGTRTLLPSSPASDDDSSTSAEAFQLPGNPVDREAKVMQCAIENNQGKSSSHCWFRCGARTPGFPSLNQIRVRASKEAMVAICDRLVTAKTIVGTMGRGTVSSRHSVEAIVLDDDEDEEEDQRPPQAKRRRTGEPITS